MWVPLPTAGVVEDFAVVLATVHEHEASELLLDFDEIHRLIYGEAEAEPVRLPVTVGEA